MKKLELYEVFIKIPVKLFCMTEDSNLCYIIEAKLNVIINLN